MPKKMKYRYGMIREKKEKNLFGSVPWANRYKLAPSEKFIELLVELFWPLRVY